MKMRTMALGVLAAVLAAATAWPPGARAQPPLKVGVVDLQRCLNESKMGKRYQEEFSTEMEQLRANLDREETELKALREELEKQSTVLSETAKAEKEKEYQGKLGAFKEKVKASQLTLQRKNQELTRRVLKDLEGVIRVLGETEGYGLIVEKTEGGVLFREGQADLTDEVIKRYDGLQGQ